MSSFTMLTPLPNQIERIWAFNKNKEVLQILFQEYIANLAKKDKINIVLSGYITNIKINPCVEVRARIEKEKPELNVEEEEADTRIVSHVNDAVKNGFEKIVIASNNMLVISKKRVAK